MQVFRKGERHALYACGNQGFVFLIFDLVSVRDNLHPVNSN